MTKINSIIDFPNLRKQYTGEDNPMFVTDPLNATESILTAMDNICGFPNPGFRILSGLEASGPDFTPGVFWLNGEFYYASNGVSGGNTLRPLIDAQFSKIFGDSNARTTYSVYLATDESSPMVGDSPIFSGTMDQYRANLEALRYLQIEDNWIYVGSGGSAPVFGTGVSNEGTGTHLRFKKDTYGNVHIEGYVSTTTLTPTIFILPRPYRPALDKYYIVPGNAVSTSSWYGRLRIDLNGAVSAEMLLGTTAISLELPTFKTD